MSNDDATISSEFFSAKNAPSAFAIDDVITHELCHIAEPNHGAAFYELLDHVLPDWQHRKQRLERILA